MYIYICLRPLLLYVEGLYGIPGWLSPRGEEGGGGRPPQPDSLASGEVGGGGCYLQVEEGGADG